MNAKMHRSKKKKIGAHNNIRGPTSGLEKFPKKKGGGTILSLLVKYLVIFHADPCNKSYIYMYRKSKNFLEMPQAYVRPTTLMRMNNS